jgi:hypothetical protein
MNIHHSAVYTTHIYIAFHKQCVTKIFTFSVYIKVKLSVYLTKYHAMKKNPLLN